MSTIRETVDQDYMIEQLKAQFQCTVHWCEGRACLEYRSEEELEQISDYVRSTYDKDLLDVFFTAIESLPIEEE